MGRLAPLTLLLAAVTTRAAAQSSPPGPLSILERGDSAPGLHTTLAGWADDALLQIVDRDAARGGRLSDRGILQRFWFDIDPDYTINLMRMRFDLIDDYEWYKRGNGVRYWGGSVNTRDEAIGAEFKARVPLDSSWSADVDLRHQSLLELNRSLVRLRMRRTARTGFYAAIDGAFAFHKPSSDVGVAVGWRRNDNQFELGLIDLDAFNNWIYGGLKVENTPADTALDYRRQPLLLHGRADFRPAPGWRVEAEGGVMRPATIRAFVQFSPDSGFNQDERYGYGGVLVEWFPSTRLTAGGFATVVRAVMNRTPLLNGGAANDFRLTERTVQAGGSFLVRLTPRWLLQSWLARIWRPERRTFTTGAGTEVNYEDVAWSGQAALLYRPARGFTGGLTFDLDRRDVLRGDGEEPAHEPLGRHNTEIRGDFGWRFANRSLLDLGLSYDLDPGIYARGWFGGAHGRFALYW